jgi:CRP/FNR family transcriptional regulator
METCLNCKAPLCISHLSLFGSLSDAQQALIVSNVNRVALKKGEIYIREQDPLNTFVVINRGRFKAYTDSHDGRRSVVYFYKSGDFFGENSLFKPALSPFTVECVEDGSLCTIKANIMQQLIRKEPELSLSILANLSSRVEQLENEIKSVHVERLENRLFALLESFENDYGELRLGQRYLRLPLNQEEMASRLGSSREAVSRTLKKMELAGKIKLLPHKEIIIY